MRAGATEILSQTDLHMELMVEQVGPSSTVTPPSSSLVVAATNTSAAETPASIPGGSMGVIVVGAVAAVRIQALPCSRGIESPSRTHTHPNGPFCQLSANLNLRRRCWWPALRRRSAAVKRLWTLGQTPGKIVAKRLNLQGNNRHFQVYHQRVLVSKRPPTRSHTLRRVGATKARQPRMRQLRRLRLLRRARGRRYR